MSRPAPPACSRLALPSSAGATLPEDAYVGVSSFGFAGNNAHVVVRRADPARAADLVLPSVRSTGSRMSK